MERKYEMSESDTVAVCGHVLHRIIALKDFSDIKKGDLGGYIQSENNLSHHGNCWVYDDAKVLKDAKVIDDASIHDCAVMTDSAEIRDSARMDKNSLACNHALITGNSYITDSAEICGEAMLKDTATAEDECSILDMAIVSDGAVIRNTATVRGESKVYGGAVVYGNAIIRGCARIHGDAVIFNNAICGTFANITRCNDYIIVPLHVIFPEITNPTYITLIGVKKYGELIVSCMNCSSCIVEEFVDCIDMYIQPNLSNNEKAMSNLNDIINRAREALCE